MSEIPRDEQPGSGWHRVVLYLICPGLYFSLCLDAMNLGPDCNNGFQDQGPKIHSCTQDSGPKRINDCGF